jgi:hypothetical protein
MADVLMLGFGPMTGDWIDEETGRAFTQHPIDSNERAVAATTVIVWLAGLPQDQASIGRRKTDIRQAAARGARLILCVGEQSIQAIKTELGTWLLNALGVSIRHIQQSELKSRVPQLTSYFRNHVTHLALEGPADASVLADVVDSSYTPIAPAAIRFRFERADIVIVPVSEDPWKDALEFEALLPRGQEYPSYLDELEVADEERLLAERKQHMEALALLDEQLRDARATKQILYFTDMDLQSEVVRFLRESLGLNARDVPGNHEDFRLSDGAGSDWCIGEVKGPGKENVSRPDVGKLVAHRGDADLPDNFPGLLVANTFHRGQSLAERDQSVHPDVTRWAAQAHVMIVRTLDLVRLKILSNASPRAIAEFEAAIRSGGGWYEVTDQLDLQVHQS